MRRQTAWAVGGVLLVAVLLWVIVEAGAFLVLDDPQRSDVILVLAGETDHRPARALQLLDQGYARRVVIDVPAEAKIYQFSQLQLAQDYVQHLPEAPAVSVCPISGLSTRDESHDAEKCLGGESGNRILIVTSDFHTRRALAIFRHEVRGKSFSVAAAYNDSEFGPRWWSHRQWAKTFANEWVRLLWWSAIDRWR
jgi:hypothetical protein